MKKPIRYCFARDNDSHLYLIPASLKDEFTTKMELAYETDDFDEFEEQFKPYRKGSDFTNFSFTDPLNS